ncbi:MAG: DUF1343 domain-containing protein [Cyclobacteriaceae bacterium]|nr:DUF1343 domain-containing protein [Cyclobacteriaceae bacterium]
MIRSFFSCSILAIFFIASCQAQQAVQPFLHGAAQTDMYLPKIQDKKVGLLVNHTSRVDSLHLLDFLLTQGVEVKKIFAPEHGFRGQADAGETVKDNVDRKTGIPVVSLYGNNKKPDREMLSGLDVVIFDIQDVGTRFYTYISSMHYLMEACAANKVKVMIFDRPNPNGQYIDGPILEPAFRSFVGMHPIPVVHGLTVGELANMINGEGWLDGGITCELEVVPMQNYRHSDFYSLPVKPSPNLPNDQSVRLYPSLCFFEGTAMSIGRGTVFPFQVIGYPDKDFGQFTFTPTSIDGMAKHPKLEGKLCHGVDLREASIAARLDLSYLITYYMLWKKSEPFFTAYFDTLAGTDKLRKQIESGMSEAEIRQSWRADLQQYQNIRSKYLLYKD